MITILFYVTVKDGKEQEFHDLAVRLTEVTRAEDDGCLAYVFHEQFDNPNEYVLYEQWQDQEALDIHIEHLLKLFGPPAPEKALPKAFDDLCENTKTVYYNMVA